MFRLLSLTAVCALCAACARGPSAVETLPKLREAIANEVDSALQNEENSALVEQVSQGRHLHGLSRGEVERQLGTGDRCARHPLCAERGFDPQDWYYEVGKTGAAHVRARPALIVGFSRFGKVERTFVLRAHAEP